LESHPGKLTTPSAGDLVGYWDGIIDGAADNAASHSYEPKKTINYLKAGQDPSHVHENPGEFEREYRDGYLTGYQQGYSSQAPSSFFGSYPDGDPVPKSARGAPCSTDSAPVSK
jgi:hypothetical protein